MVVKLLENHEQVDRILGQIRDELTSMPNPNPLTAQEAVSLAIELTRKQFLEYGSKAPLFDPNNPALLVEKWTGLFTVIAKSVLSIRLGIATWSRSGFIEMLMKKHDLYGAAPITNWSMLGIIIRIDSKWQRYCNQMDKEVEDRHLIAMEDTLTDILGYCILGLAFLETFDQRYGI